MKRLLAVEIEASDDGKACGVRCSFLADGCCTAFALRTHTNCASAPVVTSGRCPQCIAADITDRGAALEAVIADMLDDPACDVRWVRRLRAAVGGTE